MTRVLVVDDNEDTVHLYVETLKEAGFDAVGTTDPNEALNAAITNRPDVVVTDLAMPTMDGTELAQLLRSYAPTRDIPLVVVSAHVFDFRRHAAPPGGWDACLHKPIEPQALVSAVRSVLAAPARRVDAGEIAPPPPSSRNGTE